MTNEELAKEMEVSAVFMETLAEEQPDTDYGKFVAARGAALRATATRLQGMDGVLRELVALLRRLGMDSDGNCRVCGGYIYSRPDGHTAYCELSQTLSCAPVDVAPWPSEPTTGEVESQSTANAGKISSSLAKAPEQSLPVAEMLAREFHALYEELAPEYGYETRLETREFDPESSNGKLMIAVCSRLSLAAENAELRDRWRKHEESDEYDGTPVDGVYLGDLCRENASLKEVLREVEWTERHMGIVKCPVCGCFERHGHAPDCKLAAALEGGPNE